MSVDQLRPFVRRLAERASARSFNYMAAKPRTVEDMREAITTLAAVYAQSAALLAANWYEEQNPDSRYSAHADDDLAEQKLDDIVSWMFSGPQLPENRAKVAAHRLVFDAARRTVFVNADDEGVAIARHESATECRKCQGAATLGERHRHQGSEDVDQEFHPMCEGLFVPVRSEVWTPPAYTANWPRSEAIGQT